MRDFCLNLVKTTTEHREKNNIVKKDLIQYLIQLRNNNDTTEIGPDGDEWKINATGIQINTRKKNKRTFKDLLKWICFLFAHSTYTIDIILIE